jgi:hypothetical protein
MGEETACPEKCKVNLPIVWRNCHCTKALHQFSVSEKNEMCPSHVFPESVPSRLSSRGYPKRPQTASVFAELERAMIRERTKAAMNVKRGRNERMSHKVPFGWDEGGDGILERNEKEQRAIAWMRQLKREGKSLRQIASLLNERGVEPKQAKRWLHSSVLRILARTA